MNMHIYAYIYTCARDKCIQAAKTFLAQVNIASRHLERAEPAEQTLLSASEHNILASIFDLSTDRQTINQEEFVSKRDEARLEVGLLGDGYASRLQEFRALTEVCVTEFWQKLMDGSESVRCKKACYALSVAAEDEILWHSFGWRGHLKLRCRLLVLVSNWLLVQISNSRCCDVDVYVCV
jgi:hypothetical protein